MNEINVAYRKWTKYSIPGTVPLAFVGLWLILLTFPNLFYAITRNGLPPGLSALLDFTHRLTQPVLNQQQIIFSVANLYLTIALPLLVYVLIAAALLRSARAQSWAPALSMFTNLILGVLAFPLFSWIAQIVLWVFGLGPLLTDWFSSMLANGVVRIIGMVVGGLVSLVVLVSLVAWMIKSVRGRWVAGIAAAVALGLFLVKDAIGPPLLAVASVAATVVTTVFGYLFIVVMAVVLWLIAVFVLAYLGASLITPIRDAIKAGRETGALADVAAGVGVAISTIVTAASYGHVSLLQEAAILRATFPLGGLPNLLDLQFQAIMPPSFEPLMTALFTGFNATPDLLLVALVCVLGTVALTFSPGRNPSMQEAPATILTFAFLRVLALLAGVVLALWLTGSDADG